MNLGRFWLYILSFFCFFWVLNCEKKQKKSLDAATNLSQKIHIESLYFTQIPETHYELQTHLSPLSDQEPIVVEFKTYQILPQAQQIRFKTLAGTYYVESICQPTQVQENKELMWCEALFENRKNDAAKAHYYQKVALYFFRFLDVSGQEAKIVDLTLDHPSNYVFLNYLQNDGSVNYTEITPLGAANFEPLKIGLVNNQIKAHPVYTPLAKELSYFCQEKEGYRSCEYKVQSGDQKTEHSYEIQFFYYPRITNIRSLVVDLNLSYSSSVLANMSAEEHMEIQASYFPKTEELEFSANKSFVLNRDEKNKNFIIEFEHYTGETIKYYLDFRSFLQITRILLENQTQDDWNQQVKRWHSGKNAQLILKYKNLYPEKISLETNPPTWQITNIETLALSTSNNPNELDIILDDTFEEDHLISKHLLSPVRRITLNNIDGEERDYYLYLETEDVKLTEFKITNPLLLSVFSEPNVQKWKPAEEIFIETLRVPNLIELNYKLEGFNYIQQAVLDTIDKKFELNIIQRNGKKFSYLLRFQTLEIDEIVPNFSYLTQTNDQIGLFFIKKTEEGFLINPFNPLEPKIDEQDLYLYTFLKPDNDLFTTIKIDDNYAKVEQRWSSEKKQEYILKVSSKKNPNRFVNYIVPVGFFKPENILRINEIAILDQNYYLKLGSLTYQKPSVNNNVSTAWYDYSHLKLENDIIPKDLIIQYRTFFDRLTKDGDWSNHDKIQSFFNIKIAYDRQAKFSRVEQIVVENKNSVFEQHLKFWIKNAWDEETQIANIVLKQDTQPEFMIKMLSYNGQENRIGGGDLYFQKANLLQITQKNVKNDFNWGVVVRQLNINCALTKDLDLLRNTEIRRDQTLDFFPVDGLSSTIILELDSENQELKKKAELFRDFVFDNRTQTLSCLLNWQDGNVKHTAEQNIVINKEYSVIRSAQDFLALDYAVRYGQSRSLEFQQKQDIDFSNLNQSVWTSNPMPFGTKNQPFKWSYNGNNYKISNLAVPLKPNSEKNYGVFGYVQVRKTFFDYHVEFEKINFINLVFQAAPLEFKTGLLIGNVEFLDSNLMLKISDCSFTNSDHSNYSLVVNTNKKFSALGGLIGHTEGATGSLRISNTRLRFSYLTPSVNNHYTGLILGYASNELLVSLSTNQIELDQNPQINFIGGGKFTLSIYKVQD